MKLKKLKKGEYFKILESGKTIYIKGHYDKASKSFSCCKTTDMNAERFFKASKEITTEFEY